MAVVLAIVEGLWDFEGADDEDLSFQAGDILEVIDQSDPDWWQVRWLKTRLVAVYKEMSTYQLLARRGH